MMRYREQRLFFWLIIVVLATATAFVFERTAAAETTASPPLQEGNLLQNPGFEGQFNAWNGINEIQVAANWTPWWWEDPNHNPAYFRPEYKRADAAFYPNRVLAGSSAQQWFTFHASHYAGMYQQVFNVQPGQRYRFNIWAQVWSSIEDNAYVSVLPANPHLQVGIDPTGNWNPGSGQIVWSPEGSMSSHIDQWAQISVEATASSDVITVFMRTNPDFANKHNDMYWDNASLVALGPPPPPPTNTPLPATNTPEVTNTPVATATPLATATPEATDTPEATATAPPTDTPEPTDRPTAVPTDTAEPSPTVSPEPATATSAPPAATEVAANPTADPGPDEPAEDEATEGDSLVDRLPPFIGLVLLGLGVIIGLAIAGAVVLLRRSS